MDLVESYVGLSEALERWVAPTRPEVVETVGALGFDVTSTHVPKDPGSWYAQWNHGVLQVTEVDGRVRALDLRIPGGDPRAEESAKAATAAARLITKRVGPKYGSPGRWNLGSFHGNLENGDRWYAGRFTAEERWGVDEAAATASDWLAGAEPEDWARKHLLLGRDESFDPEPSTGWLHGRAGASAAVVRRGGAVLQLRLFLDSVHVVPRGVRRDSKHGHQQIVDGMTAVLGTPTLVEGDFYHRWDRGTRWVRLSRSPFATPAPTVTFHAF